jgi:UDP-N-acetylmuramate--L-alanine ligase/UDP-N-acetylenolpyruvoylglucosamine reductase
MSDCLSRSAEIQSRLSPAGGHVHLVGICGVGMAGLALLLKSRGFRVSGCDQSASRLADWLRSRGIEVQTPHAPGHLEEAVDWVVRTAAAPLDSPELGAAARWGIPVYLRGEVLPEILKATSAIAVSGTHGKTTTSTFITQMLCGAGRDPSWCIGGENDLLGGVAGVGRGGLTVVEADESDGTLALYHPDIAVVTNIEFDHMEHFGTEEHLLDCFRTFAGQARCVVYCADDTRACRVCRGRGRTVSYGFSAEADFSATDIVLEAGTVRFQVLHGGRPCVDLHLPVPGRHNVLNALAAVAVGVELGVTPDAMRTALAGACLPRRRFEKVVDRPDCTVISDYAHHPTEIRALIQAAQGLGRSRILAVFQPHRYTRTRALGPEFPSAFAGLHTLVLVPVYAASEPVLSGGTSEDLYTEFRLGRERGEPAAEQVYLTGSLEAAWSYLRRELRPGDLLLVIGAGDVEKIAGWARDCSAGLPQAGTPGPAPGPSLASRTTLGVGGVAETWAPVTDEKALCWLIRACRQEGVPFRVIGAGSNLLISDLGVRGVVCRLEGPAFAGVRREGERVVVAGAGVPLNRLLDRMGSWGLGGLEFLQDIPGTLGGAVCMNAGAWGDEIGRHVEWIRCLNCDGEAFTLRRDELGFAYRSCAGLSGRVVLEVALTADPVPGPESAQRRADIAAKRAWMKGLRSAGSVFRNPPGQSAGRLLDEAGWKGGRVGGAEVSAVHANVIVTRPGATASDVRALMRRMQDRVRERSGVELEPEVIVWE